MTDLWRGDWPTRLRIATGLVLFVYATLHFINIGLGLISPAAMDAMQAFRKLFTRSLPGEVLIYGALVLHAGLALWKLASLRTLKMPVSTAWQTLLGLLIPILLAAHVTHTRVAHEQFQVNDEMGYIMLLLWNSMDGWLQTGLLLGVWVHGALGLHFWLRAKPWWQRVRVPRITLAALVPAFALAGFMTEGRRVQDQFAQEEARAELMAQFNFPDFETFGVLIALTRDLQIGYIVLVGAVVALFVGRKLLHGSRSVRVSYVDGPTVYGTRGATLLEISRANGVAHTSLCGGRGRCTTCRVIIEDGTDALPAPSPSEAAALRAVDAPAGARLACQLRPDQPTTVFRVFRADGRRGRAHASQGQERRLAVLFLDMRGFTARTTGLLPYDVVFLLNRFFDSIVPAITRSGGSVDKYLGDGLLAVFETADEATSARAALTAAAEVGTALDAFNAALAAEGAAQVRIGMGLHLGELVLGEIGAAGNAPRTIIGDTVNTASRLEAMTKTLGAELLVSADLLRAAGEDPEGHDLTPLDLRGVAGTIDALAVARLTDLRGQIGAI